MLDAAPSAPPQVAPCFSIAVTGHRRNHPCFAGGIEPLTATLTGLFDRIDALLGRAVENSAGPFATTRLFTLLADGTDQEAAALALARGYDLHCPLPFGEGLNAAINAHPVDSDEARAILSGGAARDPATATNLRNLRHLASQARLFELAEQDERMTELFLAARAVSHESAAAQLFRAEAAVRVAAAGQILVEQADLLIGWWDGVTSAPAGGTGDTIRRALDNGTPVLWIDPAQPEAWSIITTPEAMVGNPAKAIGSVDDQLRAIIHGAVAVEHHAGPTGPYGARGKALETERWKANSRRRWHAYRRIEALFGSGTWSDRFASLRQTYEPPEAIATGSAAPVMATLRGLDGLPTDYPARIDQQILRRFAWADGISAYLSDAYRSGMTVNFLLSALAISGGIAYLPLVSPAQKWGFALFELALLLLILAITGFGRRQRWHDRWFETRRVAEYLRHGPVMLALGVARPVGRWSSGAAAGWPEHYARAALRSVGLPTMRVTPAFLRGALTGLLGEHVIRQRDYHRAKADRLAAVHHNLDRVSQRLFQAAVLSVSIYLALTLLAALGVMAREPVEHVSKLFTVLGVVLPTFGAAIAGIRYFGDFERFAAISEVAADKLDGIASRIAALAAGPDQGLTYARVATLAHAADDVVVAEIESWQAVFAGKHVTVPV